MLNTWTGMGRFTAEPELRTTQTGVPVVSFTLANENDFGEKHTDFINIVAWRQAAEFVCKNFHKGQMAIVTGRLQSRKWEDRNGQKRTEWEIQADRVYFGEAKRDSQPKAPDVEYTEVDDDEELPFD